MEDQKGIQNNIFTKVSIFNSEGKQVPNALLFSKDKQHELNDYFEKNKRTPLDTIGHHWQLKKRQPIITATSGKH
jgi:hypothetical protein